MLLIHAHITICTCPHLHPHDYPAWKNGFYWVWCLWCSLAMSPEHFAQCGICCWSWWLTAASWKQMLCSDWPVVWMLVWINLLCSPPGIEVHYSYIHKLLWAVCASKALLFGSYFSFCPYISSYPFPLPFGTDVLLFLYPPTCFTHTHTCSLSLAELHFGPERELVMKRNHSFLIKFCCGPSLVLSTTASCGA